MLSKFIYNDCYKKVPYTGSVYEIDCKGNLRNSFTKRELKRHVDENGVTYVTSGVGEWFDDFKLAVLLAIVHRNNILPIRMLQQLDVIYKDNDPRNYSLYNTVWKCPEGELTHPDFPGFCYIPGFSRYLINREGDLLSPIKGEILSPYTDSNGYLMYGVQPDVGKRTIVGMHRLKSLAWKKYPANVDRLDINHLDVDKANNDLDNLEWATRSRNNFHAHENGLSNSEPLMIRDIVTDEITTYYSVSDAARHLGIDPDTLSLRVKSGVDGRVYEGHQYKLKSDKSPWLRMSNPDDYPKAVIKKAVLVTDVELNKSLRLDSISKAAQYIDVNPSTLSYRLARSDKTVFGNYLVELCS